MSTLTNGKSNGKLNSGHAPAKKNGRPRVMTREQVLRAVAMEEKGWPINSIGRHFGTTARTIYNGFHRLEAGDLD